MHVGTTVEQRFQELDVLGVEFDLDFKREVDPYLAKYLSTFAWL